MVRITTFFVTAPIFSAKGVAAQFKIGLGFFIALLIIPIVGINLNITDLNGTFLFYLFQEALIGLTIGWVAQLMFTSIQVAGSFVDLQIGFSLANVIDPQTGAQSPVMGNFKYTFAVLLFFALDIHHIFIEGIIASYQFLPISGEWVVRLNDEPILLFILAIFAKMFVVAFKIAAPIVITLFLADVALGIIARTVPQLNVFVVGIPMKVMLNFLLLSLISASLIYIFKDLFQEMINSISQFLELMR